MWKSLLSNTKIFRFLTLKGVMSLVIYQKTSVTDGHWCWWAVFRSWVELGSLLSELIWLRWSYDCIHNENHLIAVMEMSLGIPIHLTVLRLQHLEVNLFLSDSLVFDVLRKSSLKKISCKLQNLLLLYFLFIRFNEVIYSFRNMVADNLKENWI